MAWEMGLYCFFKCGMYCTNITLLSIFCSILCANIDQQGEGLRTERASSSKFCICFTHVHNVSPMFIHFPTFSPACCSERTWQLHFFCKKSPGWRATTGAQLPLQDAQLSEGRVDANEQRMGTKM
jgi:hypothetical protein